MSQTNWDVIDVTGTLTLDGVLEIDLLDSFVPSLGEIFDLFTAETISGDFDVLTVPIPPAVLLFGSALLGLVSVARRGDEGCP